ncbi:alanine racemase [Occallatibacter riparius]|uniref:Alanine racemase n=1 Tax=Occallatibacter riparius TaxID=1002689 RepID=A0A9J7BPN4_9BACT|nr:alanine racemase [Occallatibacter riparius]UWZ84731.1 alanine racemase [Occallatibacter riparius]
MDSGLDSTLKTRPCRVEIRTLALEDNYRFLRGLAGPDAECLAIVKADAYGHGLALCAPAAVRAGAHWLGVTSVEEGVAARAACLTAHLDARILIIGGVFPGQCSTVLEHSLTPVAWDGWHFDELETAARASGAAPQSVGIHLEIDTGMSRQGVALRNLPSLLARFGPESPLRVEAVMTHLYASDEAHGETTPAQLARLEEALAAIESQLPAGVPKPEFLSVGASAALLGGDGRTLRDLAGRHNLVPMLRLGLALYGLAPAFDPDFPAGHAPATLTSARASLQPVLEWKTRVVSVREIPADTEIGYNGTFVATEPMRLALIALGYADGIDRRLGNRFSLLVRGQRAPLVGRISMDQAVLDVTEIDGVGPGHDVVILGAQGGEVITAFDHAAASGTIPWEIFTRIASRVRRVEV